ncbi:MAG: hypothetical protein NTX15_00785, partial [Candidatus Kapabacteria bacterium]|nr:hypothetical protein [Candidatus Kapabacteria bacterium]
MSKPNDYTVRQLAAKIFPFVRPFWKLIVFSTVANLLFSAANALVLAIVEPVFRTLFNGTAPSTTGTSSLVTTGMKARFDEIISSILIAPDYYDSIRNISLVIFALFFVRGLTKYIGNIISTRLEEGIMKRIRDSLFQHITSQSMDF